MSNTPNIFPTEVALGISGYNCVTAELHLPDPIKCVNFAHKIYVYDRGDYRAMSSELDSHLAIL